VNSFISGDTGNFYSAPLQSVTNAGTVADTFNPVQSVGNSLREADRKISSVRVGNQPHASQPAYFLERQ
jgi:hypothetical protein